MKVFEKRKYGDEKLFTDRPVTQSELLDLALELRDEITEFKTILKLACKRIIHSTISN